VRDNNGSKPKNSRARFILGAAVGVAISIPIFSGIESSFIRFILMFAFGGLMGYGQVFAARDTPGSRRFLRLAIVGSVVALVLGLVIFMNTA
jgi:hypothetical protein